MPGLLLMSVLERRRARSELRRGLQRYLEFDLIEAERSFTNAVSLSRRSGKAAAIADADEHLYLVMRRRRRDAEAVGLLRELVETHERLGGPASDAACAWRNELTSTLGRLERFNEAEPLCRQRLELAIARRGEVGLRVGYAEVTLAWCLRHLGRWEEAEIIARSALAHLEHSAGHDAPITGWPLVGLATSLLHQHRWEEAEECLQRAHANWDRVGMTALSNAALSRLADLYLAAERFADALAASDRRRRMTRGMSGAQLPALATQLWELERHAFLLRSLGRDSEAVRFEIRSAALRKLVDAEPRPSAGGDQDPDGPLFDCEAVTDWAGAGDTAARAC